MAAIWYNRGKTRVLAGDTALDSTDIRAGLITGTKTGADNPDLNTVADLDAVSGVGIHTERVALASKTVTQDDTNNRANVDSADIVFASSAGVTALAWFTYDEGGGTDATRHLLTFDDVNFGAGKPLDGGLTITVADWARGS
jgi:hypothetical protein